VIEAQNSIVASASRNRTTLAVNRNEVADRVTRDKLSANAFDAAQRRKEIIDEAIVRQERAIDLRRNDLEESYEQARSRAEQTRFADTVANDTVFQNRQAEIAAELANQRSDRAAVYSLTLSEFDEGLALDQIEADIDTASATPAVAPQVAEGPSFRSFLAERENRNTERAVAEQDRSVQQQIDLQIADNNLRSIPSGGDLPRGALVDVLG